MKYSVFFLLFYPVDFLIACFFWLISPLFKNRNSQAPWVIGGHRGRIYEDNSGALHTYLINHTEQPVIWIASDKTLIKKLKSENCMVLRKNSFRARFAILRAPVLIYSHGEDDLDQFLRYFRKRLGLRIYLNHCANFCKTGYFATPEAIRWSDAQRKSMAKKIVDFDYLLAGSAYEREMFLKAFPYKDPSRIVPDSGAAHVDKLLLNKKNAERCILWFPTFRDEENLQRKLEDMKQFVLHSERLRHYLQETNTTLVLVSHINSKSNISSDFSHIIVESTSKLGELLSKSMCLVSDYSGVVIDWLVFDRPFIRFAFDEKDYMKKRSFYIPLREFAIGPEAWTAEEFVDIVISESWKDLKPFEEKRRYFKNRIYPIAEPVYAKRSYETILKILRNHSR